jgi:predicted lipoprotein with Yx(FWY)xxD motif
MDPTRRRLLRTIAATGTVGAVAGCLDQTPGSNQAETTIETTPTDTATPESTDTGMEGEVTVDVAEHPEHGEILVDSEGMTLYLFTQDEPGESVCYDSCAENWPPLTVEDSPSGSDDLPGDLSTIERDDGTMQVTYNGWPLYYWVQDEGPGDATGQGVNDVWFVVATDQEPPEGDDGDDSDNGGGYGSDY